MNERVIVDTDFISLYLRGDLLTKQYVEDMLSRGYLFTTTSITSAEIFFGVHKQSWKNSKIKFVMGFLEKIGIIEFSYKHSQIYGKLRSNLQKKGIEIGFVDTAIAAICLVEKLKLFTFNRKDFEKVDNLELF